MNRRQPHRTAPRPPRRAPAHAPPDLFTRIVLGATADDWLDELPPGADLWPPPDDSAANPAPADRFPSADEFSTFEPHS